MKKHYIILGLLGVILSGSGLYINNLPTEKSILFSGSGNCTQCHSGTSGVLINSKGRDVSPVFHWQSSMMGNSAKDPYWQAKVSSEVEENSHIKEIIEDKCLTCHAPMGRTEAVYNGQTHYSFSEMKTDPLSLDGVSCTVCHQIDPDNLSPDVNFSGKYVIKPLKQIYGPYTNPFTNSMVNNTGYTPVYGQHIQSSLLCATCHTLTTPYVDQEGNVAGYFPEQMPYYEWLNSSYSEQKKSCQECHVPAVNEDFRIASMPPNLQNKRNPVYEHQFVGGNIIINKILKDNYVELGITSGTANLDTTSFYTTKNLKSNSIDISANSAYKNDKVLVNVTLKNKTGHKFPTGFPSRRAWLHFVATNLVGDTIFESGKYDNEGNILSQGIIEMHHDTISNEKDVQIYEAVLGNTQNNVTTILLEASQYLKDNRIPPVGFTNDKEYNDLIAVTGNALKDNNFNRNTDGSLGSGSDQITYTFPYIGKSLNCKIELCYQSIKPDFVNHLSESKTSESIRFSQMFSKLESPKLSVISTLDFQIEATNFINIKEINWRIFPIPAYEKIYIDGIENFPFHYSIYSSNGVLLTEAKSDNSMIPLVNVPKGINILKVKSGKNEKTFSIIKK